MSFTQILIREVKSKTQMRECIEGVKMKGQASISRSGQTNVTENEIRTTYARGIMKCDNTKRVSLQEAKVFVILTLTEMIIYNLYSRSF